MSDTSATFDPQMLEKLGRLFDKAATTCHTRDAAALFIAARLLAAGYGIYRIRRIGGQGATRPGASAAPSGGGPSAARNSRREDRS